MLRKVMGRGDAWLDERIGSHRPVLSGRLFDKLDGKLGLSARFAPTPARDIRRLFRKTSIRTIFDVGANVGQSALSLEKDYPYAIIYSFEPMLDNFAKLEKATKLFKYVKCYRLALSSEEGEIAMEANAAEHTMHRVGQGGDTVQATTIDRFCTENQIPRIDYLKIDTEGHDLDVIKGSGEMLSADAISFVEAECGMNRDNTYHVPFRDIQDALEAHGYRLCGMYEPALEWPTGQPYIRRVNALFASPRTIRDNRLKA